MSWAEEDWTVGLSGRVLQKVKELQVHHERLSRENKQKQLQLDNIQVSLEKQTVKYEEVRGELQFVQRDLQSVRDEAKAAAASRERLVQELHTKQAQVCSLEGQLDATRSQNNKLTQEIKRLEAELEKLQNSSKSSDVTLFSTPCWNTSSPWEHNGSRRYDEKSGTRDEVQSQHSHIKQRLPFSDMPTSSVSRQHKSTPHRHPSDQSESFATPSSVFPWERDDTRHSARRHSPSSPQMPCSGLSPLEHSGKERDSRAQMDTSLSEMQSRVSGLEEELSAKVKMLKSIQSEMAQSKKELTARELSLQKARDEISMAHTRISQESQRASGAEQKLKQVQEELKCQRQNAESSRLQHQQRTKELEKQHQKDITELQKERQLLEKQHQQEVNKLNQELQQARTLHNALQAQADKLSLQKQALDKELDTLKEKLKWTEGQLQESQKKEAQTQGKLAEALREAETVTVSLEQSRKRERGLEEEKRSLAEERANALRLLKELQEQKAAPPPSQQPVQFHSQPSYAPPPHSSDCIKRPAATSRQGQKKKEEDVEEMQADISAPYPSDREPGEGIDSEDITVLISQDSESLGIRRNSNKEKRHEVMDCDGSQTKNSSISNPAHVLSTNTSVDVYHHTMLLSDEKSLNPEQTKADLELKRENTMLRSEIKDVREELQKRLEDLETQRRAEAETRTRLKQLSRKHASQTTEKQEQEKEWKTKLESEKLEVERLKKTIAGMETEMNKRKEERGKREIEEETKVMEDRESEMIELNIQLKKQLSEAKAQLALEREERQREQEERTQHADVQMEMSTKLAELQAELEELKHSKEEHDKGVDDRRLLANSPLAYMTLHDDELNSNVVHHDTKPLLSPEQHLLFCQSTNQINTLVSQGTDLIQGEQLMIEPKGSPLSSCSLTSQEALDQEDTDQNVLEAASLSDQQEDDFHLQKSEFSPSHLEKEVTHLQKEKAKETDRANKNQVKLEALQSQVTSQTRQLTKAFEKQSQHICGLLAELQQKEIALLRQGEEMQKCKLELEALKAEQGTKKDENPGSKEDKEAVQFSELEDSAAHLNTSNSLSDVDLSALESEEDNEALFLGDQCPDCDNSDKTESNQDSACVTEETECSQGGETTAELLILRQENRLLKQKIKDFTVSNTCGPTSHTNTQDTAVLSCPTDQWMSREQKDIKVEESLLPNQMRSEDGAEEEQEDMSQDLQIKNLEQQVVVLQMRVQALCTETQEQSEELSLWRLSSQPTATLDQFKEQNQPSAVKQSQSDQEQTEETTHVSGSPSVTVVREDQLILSCSSNKLQGRMLFSRLQYSNLPEPTDLHHSKKTGNSQETVIVDQESEKENLQWSDVCPPQHTNKSLAHFQMSLEGTGKHVSKEPSKTKPTEDHRDNPVSGPDSVRTCDETKTVSDSSERAVRVGVKSVSSQTEESPCPPAHELHSAYTQTEEEIEEIESPPVSPIPPSEGAESRDKMFTGAFPIPADPARLAERIRRNRTQLSAAFDDTEYEPYGLPEVVMKGFADIPTGPSCPYIVRRGLLGTCVVPVSQKEEETD